MNLPTKITLVRIFLIPFFIFFFFFDLIPYNRVIAVAIFAVAGITDWIDGYIARKYNLVTDLGKFLDPIADKLLVACALIAIVIDKSDFQVLIAIFSMIILSRELLISAFRLIASNKNRVLQADKLGKIKTVFQIFALIVLLPAAQLAFLVPHDIILIVGVSLLGIATFFTIISGINYLLRNWSVFSE